jgi:hypothetical protein
VVKFSLTSTVARLLDTSRRRPRRPGVLSRPKIGERQTAPHVYGVASSATSFRNLQADAATETERKRSEALQLASTDDPYGMLLKVGSERLASADMD